MKNSESIEGSTHYLDNETEFDASSEDPSSGISKGDRRKPRVPSYK